MQTEITTIPHAVPSPATYYRSQTFQIENQANPLLGAAASLFTLYTKLRACEHYEEIDSLRTNLIHEIKAFESNAQAQGYSNETILIARYALCTLLDDAIMYTPWGEETHWQDHGLLEYFHHESPTQPRFFQIAEKLLENPAHHLALLELFYLCLSLGYQGVYRHQTNPQRTLEDHLEKIYQAIREQQSTFKPVLREAKPSVNENNKKLRLKYHWIIIASCLTFITITSLYFGFKMLVDVAAQPLFDTLLQVTNTHF